MVLICLSSLLAPYYSCKLLLVRCSDTGYQSILCSLRIEHSAPQELHMSYFARAVPSDLLGSTPSAPSWRYRGTWSNLKACQTWRTPRFEGPVFQWTAPPDIVCDIPYPAGSQGNAQRHLPSLSLWSQWHWTGLNNLPRCGSLHPRESIRNMLHFPGGRSRSLLRSHLHRIDIGGPQGLPESN